MLNYRLNYPSVPRGIELVQSWMQQLAAPARYTLLQNPPVTEREMQIVKNWLRVPDSKSVVLPAPSSNTGLYCVLHNIRSSVRHIAVEPFTFPGFKMIAAEFGYQLHPVASDAEGILPDALRTLLAKGECKLVYLQPTIHNPTCSVMPLARRQAIAAVVEEFSDVYILEDDAYRFLHPSPPPSFLELLPNRTYHLFSLSKPLDPLLKAAFILHPEGTLPGIMNIIRLTTSGTSALCLKAGFHLMESGELAKLIKEKQHIAARLQEKMAQLFEGLRYSTFPNSFHIWLDTAKPDVLETLRVQHIDLPDGNDFSTSGNTTFTRIALGSCWDSDELVPQLEVIAKIVRKATLQ